MERLVPLEQVELPVRLDPQEQVDPLELLELLVSPERVDLQEHQEQVDLQEHPVSLEPQEQVVHQGLQEHQEQVVHQDLLEHQEQADLLEPQVSPELREQAEPLESLE